MDSESTGLVCGVLLVGFILFGCCWQWATAGLTGPVWAAVVMGGTLVVALGWAGWRLFRH